MRIDRLCGARGLLARALVVLFAIICALPLAAPAQAAGQPIAFGPDLAAQGWTPMNFMTIPATDYRAAGPARLDIRAQKSSSLIYRPIAPVNNAASASWRWRLDASAPPTDLSRKGGDDRPLALYFLFADDEASAKVPAKGLMDAMRRGRVLVYVWGGTAAKGAVVPDPYLDGRGFIVVRRTGSAMPGQTFDETVNLANDFKRTFSAAPGPLTGIAVSSDSDDTASINAGAISDLFVTTR